MGCMSMPTPLVSEVAFNEALAVLVLFTAEMSCSRTRRESTGKVSYR